MSIYYLGTCVKTKRVCSQQLVLSGEAASVSVTKQQFRATPRKVIDTPGWLMGNQSGTLERAIPRLPFSTYFALILPLLFKITWLTVGPVLTVLCCYCPPRTQCGRRSNFPSESGGVYWLRWQERQTAAAGL